MIVGSCWPLKVMEMSYSWWTNSWAPVDSVNIRWIAIAVLYFDHAKRWSLHQCRKTPKIQHPTSISRTQPSHAARNLHRLVLQMSCVLLWATLECELHYVLMFGADTKTRRKVNVRLPVKTTFLGRKTCSNQRNLVGEQTPVYYSNFSSIFPVWNPRPKQQLAHHWIKASDEMLENPLTLDL